MLAVNEYDEYAFNTGVLFDWISTSAAVFPDEHSADVMTDIACGYLAELEKISTFDPKTCKDDDLIFMCGTCSEAHQYMYYGDGVVDLTKKILTGFIKMVYSGVMFVANAISNLISWIGKIINGNSSKIASEVKEIKKTNTSDTSVNYTAMEERRINDKEFDKIVLDLSPKVIVWMKKGHNPTKTVIKGIRPIRKSSDFYPMNLYVFSDMIMTLVSAYPAAIRQIRDFGKFATDHPEADKRMNIIMRSVVRRFDDVWKTQATLHGIDIPDDSASKGMSPELFKFLESPGAEKIGNTSIFSSGQCRELIRLYVMSKCNTNPHTAKAHGMITTVKVALDSTVVARNFPLSSNRDTMMTTTGGRAVERIKACSETLAEITKTSSGIVNSAKRRLKIIQRFSECHRRFSDLASNGNDQSASDVLGSLEWVSRIGMDEAAWKNEFSKNTNNLSVVETNFEALSDEHAAALFNQNIEYFKKYLQALQIQIQLEPIVLTQLKNLVDGISLFVTDAIQGMRIVWEYSNILYNEADAARKNPGDISKTAEQPSS